MATQTGTSGKKETSKHSAKRTVESSKSSSFEQKPKQFTNSSARGYHTYNLDDDCPRKFYYRYIEMLRPTYSAPPLPFGSAFHEGKAEYYRTWKAKKALETAERYVIEHRSEYEDDDIYYLHRDRVVVLLSRWIERVGKDDRRRFDFIGVELSLDFPVPKLKGYRQTCRIDALVRERSSDKRIIILETKTSGRSAALTMNGVILGDQVSMYCYMAAKHLGEKVNWALPDVAYWNTGSMNAANISFHRPSEPIYRSKEEIIDFEEGLRQHMIELSQRKEALTSGASLSTTFRRNTTYCVSYGHTCEYAHLCRPNFSDVGQPQLVKVKHSSNGLTDEADITV